MQNYSLSEAPATYRRLLVIARRVQRIERQVESIRDDLDRIINDERVKPVKEVENGPAAALNGFQIRWRENGSAVVSADTLDPIDLPPALAALMSILARDEGESADEFVAWKSIELIGEALHKPLAPSYAKRITQLLWRLRSTLRSEKWPRGLIERSPLGLRLRVGRKGSWR